MSDPPERDSLETAPTLAADAVLEVGDTRDASLETARTLDVDAVPDVGDAFDGSLKTVDPSHYVIGNDVARGGMGVVRQARDTRTGRLVAVKELLSEPRPQRRRRFVREARITAQLQHPSIVPVYEVGQWPDGRPFFAMKLVGGRPFDVVVDEASDPEARLALVPRILPAVEAIAYAHQKGVIHRDLKPANVLLGEFGETIVIDWGLAKGIGEADELSEGSSIDTLDTLDAANEDVALTREGAVMGTPAYM
ncbi:MAG: serine/threonine protein kinase [Polyangiales bacterium]